jgi:regulatory protein
MKIVRVQPPQGRLGHQRVVLDNGTVLRVRPDDIMALTLLPGRDLDATVLHQLRTRAEQVLAQETAYRLLAVRLRSRHELTDRLRRRGISAVVVAAVTADLERQGLLDDDRFAGAWVRTRLALRPSGPVRLRAELAQKGVAREVITRALGETLSSQEEGTLAEDLARTRLRRYRRLPPEVAYRRLAGVLARRGFSTGVIARVLRDLLGPRSQVID